MAEASARTMTVDEFLAWAEAQPGRHELLNGHAHAMSPERVGHTRTKYAVSAALTAAIASAGLQCEMLMDGATVRVDGKTAFEPDALVRCGKPLPSDAIETPDPVIVVEVASPNPRHIDVGLKFTGYFAVPSIQHYLLIDPDGRVVVHHRRDGDEIRSRIVGHGSLRLDPPGLDLAIEELMAQD